MRTDARFLVMLTGIMSRSIAHIVVTQCSPSFGPNSTDRMSTIRRNADHATLFVGWSLMTRSGYCDFIRFPLLDTAARFFFARVRFSLASSFRYASFETLNTLRTALSNLSASVLPGTWGAGAGFITHNHTPKTSLLPVSTNLLAPPALRARDQIAKKGRYAFDKQAEFGIRVGRRDGPGEIKREAVPKYTDWLPRSHAFCHE
jgi:hypothetical protein